jgi:subtilisin family serine protease
MRFAVRTLTLAILCCTAIAPAAQAQDTAEPRTRVIVTFKRDVSFASFEREFVADQRTSNPALAYHSRAVVGAVMALERRLGFRADIFYSRALQGFAAPLTAAQIRALAADPMVAAIEPDVPLRIEPIAPRAQTIDWGITKIGADVSSTRSGDGTGTVTGVNIYVIDTGVDATHPDINVVNHVTFAGEPNADCHGHGTGVAGIIAARDNGDFTVGVAPGLPVTGVKVATCEGFSFPSIIVQGVDWVTANAVRPAVANMSLGSLIPFTAVNTAVANSAASGIVYAAAAGNGNPFANNEPLNACTSSPAGVGYNLFGIPNGVITVGATDQSDLEASFSNFGVCVNMWAPGVGVTSTWLMSAGGTFTASGTSFASPYVAGAAALLLSRVPTLPPPVVEYILLIVADVPGTLSLDGATIRRLSVRLF